MLVVLFSSNVFADEEEYIEEAKEMSTNATAAKIYLSDGTYGYHLWAHENHWVEGSLEAKASALCGKKGYLKTLDERMNIWRRYIIKCK